MFSSPVISPLKSSALISLISKSTILFFLIFSKFSLAIFYLKVKHDNIIEKNIDLSIIPESLYIYIILIK